MPAVRVRVTEGLEPVWADHDRLEQVFVNLLENAASHGASPRGTDVTVRAGGAPGWAEVEITGSGAGVPAGLAGKIFEPRVRGTTKMAGTGLGLPIARGIVEAHGGTLVVAPAIPGRPSWSRSRQIRHQAPVSRRRLLERGGGTGGTSWWLTRRSSSSWRTTRTSSTWSGPTSPPAATT